MDEYIEEAIAELHIALEAKTEEQIEAEYTENFGEPTGMSRFEMTERLLSRLQQAMGIPN